MPMKGDKTRNTIADGVYAVDVGVARNVNPRLAVGGTVSVAAYLFDESEEWDLLLGLQPRARLWLDRQLSVDFFLGPAFVVRRDRDVKIIDSPVYTVGAGINFSSWFAGFGQIDVYDSREQYWDASAGRILTLKNRVVAPYLGARLCSYWGAAASVVPLAILLGVLTS